MSTYKTVPALTHKHKFRRLLWVSALLVVWGCVFVVLPDVFEWIRGTPSDFVPYIILGLWAYLLYAYAATILNVEIDDSYVSIAIWARTKRIPLESIGSVEAIRSRGKLRKILLRNHQTYSLGSIPIIRGSRRIDRAEELLAELENSIHPAEAPSTNMAPDHN